MRLFILNKSQVITDLAFVLRRFPTKSIILIDKIVYLFINKSGKLRTSICTYLKNFLLNTITHFSLC